MEINSLNPREWASLGARMRARVTGSDFIQFILAHGGGGVLGGCSRHLTAGLSCRRRCRPRGPETGLVDGLLRALRLHHDRRRRARVGLALRGQRSRRQSGATRRPRTARFPHFRPPHLR